MQNRFNCEINIILAGSLAERFDVPLVYDWASVTRNMKESHALIADQDFMIELSDVIASSLINNSNTIEIVQIESKIQIDFAMLKASRHMAETFNIEEGFLSTKHITSIVYYCLLESIKPNKKIKSNQIYLEELIELMVILSQKN